MDGYSSDVPQEMIAPSLETFVTETDTRLNDVFSDDRGDPHIAAMNVSEGTLTAKVEFDSPFVLRKATEVGHETGFDVTDVFCKSHRDPVVTVERDV